MAGRQFLPISIIFLQLISPINSCPIAVLKEKLQNYSYFLEQIEDESGDIIDIMELLPNKVYIDQ